jgi:hypothetical protein
MTAPNAERIKELREWAGEASVLYCLDGVNRKSRADLLSLLDAFLAMREENVRLRALVEDARKMIAAVAIIKDMGTKAWKRRAETAETKLDVARPLLEAAMSEEEPLGPGVVFQAPSIRGHSIIEKANAYRAALRQREEKGEGE